MRKTNTWIVIHIKAASGWSIRDKTISLAEPVPLGERCISRAGSRRVKAFKDGRGRGSDTPSLGLELKADLEIAADEQALAEAGNRTVHRVHEETESFVRTQSWAVTT